MKRIWVAVAATVCLVSTVAFCGQPSDPETAVDQVLDAFHQAAADANGELYFSLLSDDLVFMGTDATERWTVDEFKAFAVPYFSQGRGWTYRKTQRYIRISGSGETAWFDEMLWNDSYGTCRGTGVLILKEDAWKIVQYNLSIPMPNDLAREFTTTIKQHEAEKNTETRGSQR